LNKGNKKKVAISDYPLTDIIIPT